MGTGTCGTYFGPSTQSVYLMYLGKFTPLYYVRKTYHTVCYVLVSVPHGSAQPQFLPSLQGWLRIQIQQQVPMYLDIPRHRCRHCNIEFIGLVQVRRYTVRTEHGVNDR